jgi:cyclase
MQVIPAIDVLDGNIVRLSQGDFGRVTTYGKDILTLARKFEENGATALHLVNLSGAKRGALEQSFLEYLRTLKKGTSLSMQVGGGVRTLQDVEYLLDSGASSVILGTAALKEPRFLRATIDLFGQEKIIAALDTFENMVRVRGWQETLPISIEDACRLVCKERCKRVLITDIAKDGMERGPNFTLYRQLLERFPDLSLIASGGIRSPKDCRTLEAAGCESAVIGKALLENTRPLKEYFDFCKSKKLNNKFVQIERILSLPCSATTKKRRRSAGSCEPQRWSRSTEGRVGSWEGHRRWPSHDSLAIRVIPCLDITGGRVVKGTKFQNLRDAGDPVEIARRYSTDGADELVFLDITATSDKRQTMVDLVAKIADAINIPFTVGGGIRSVDDARTILNAGADKISVNSAAVRDPTLLSSIARELGRANTVCAIDAKRKGKGWTVLVRGGREDTGIDAIAWAKDAVLRGAGELLVTSFDRDGTGEGFDTELLNAIKQVVKVPVIASGGGRSLQSFVDAVNLGLADAVLAASIFHFGEQRIRDVKNALKSASFPVRL